MQHQIYLYINSSKGSKMDQPQKKTQQQPYLDYIVSALHRKKKKNQQPVANTNNSTLTYKKLYETMTNVVSDLDESINNCKKYNQAKIHRKYQIMLNDQRRRIQFLEEKIREEHKARSPSKKYIEDLLDKLIGYKFENQTLVKRNGELGQQNQDLKKRLMIYQSHAPTKDQKSLQSQSQPNQQSSTNPQISSQALKSQILTYLKVKNQLRLHQVHQKTKFQRFLKKNKQKLSGWTMRQFLQAIDKWSVECLNTNDYSMIMDSGEMLQQPRTQVMKGVANGSSLSYQYNGSGNGSGISNGSNLKNMSTTVNRSLGTKIHVRNKKTFSYRNFVNSRVVQDGILR